MLTAIDGVLTDDPRIAITDRAVLYGEGVFTVLRTHLGRPVDLERHLDRMFTSIAALGFEGPTRETLVASITAALRRHVGEARIRAIATQGGRAIAMVEELPPPPPSVTLAVVDLPLPRRQGPGHKLLAFADPWRARTLARAAGADEAIRLGPDGDALECATANLFIVQRGRVITPPLVDDVLPGIVRSRICELAPVTEQRITLAELQAADEIFITSSLRGVVPASRLGARPLPDAPHATRIAAAYRDALPSSI